jgi:hypothetical protein
MIISFLFATLLLFMFNIVSQMVSYSNEISTQGKLSFVSMTTIILTLILVTWNIFAIIWYFN